MAVFPDAKPVKYGRFVLLDRINVGGMAEVFRGKMGGVAGFERMVALKRILPNIAADPDFVDMFIDEAKLAVQLQHANIAQILELGKEEETYFIAMEYVSGVDLRTMWDRARNRNRLLPIAMSCYAMQKVCEGLDFAHRKKDDQGTDIGLVHRDVSPQNILVSYEGEVKVIDFGIARAANKVSKTQAGVLKGKFGYMSPEQVRGMELDNRSDIFACGVVLYELLVGDRLFLGESDFSTLEKVRNVEMVPPTRLNKSLSPQLERIVMKALAKNREDRYRWASEMGEDLQRYLFSTNQPFARTDMQRYMQQHFKEEMDKEKQRLDRYKTISYNDIVKESRPASAFSDTPSAPEPPVPPARLPSVLKATPLSFADAMVREPSVAPTPQPALVVPPVPAKPRLPAWAAAVIGALSTLLLLGGGIATYFLVFSKPKPGGLVIEASPPKAEILLNDRLIGNQTPATLEDLAPDTYVLTVRAEGYEPLVRAVKVVSGETRLENVVLQKRAGNASLVVRSTPEGLKVFVDGADTGRITPATLVGLTSGEHTLALRRDDGSIAHRWRLVLGENAAESTEIDTRRLPPVLDISSVPPGAEIRVGGQLKGTTPTTIPGLPEGEVKIELSLPGCRPVTETVTLIKATVTPVESTLDCSTAAPAPAENARKVPVNITASAVADIFIDGEKVGRTPVLGLQIAEGRRALKLVPLAPDKTPYETEVLLEAGTPKEIHHQF